MKFDSSTQTIGWFRDRYQDGSLIIKPPYQRKPVWTARQKCYLIESILLDLPVPEIYIHQTTSVELMDEFGVVDGQQRIRTILQFIGSESDPEEAIYNKFILDKLNADSPWRNADFAALPDDVRKRFVGYRFAVRYLNTDSDDQVRDMFTRLNKFLTPLNPQELRNATYSGPFVKLVNDLADNPYWAENGIVSPALIRRSKDVEFVSELLIGVLHGPQGGSGAIVDEYYQTYEDYDDEFPGQPKAKKLFEDTLTLIQQVLPDLKGFRWSNKTDYYTLFVAIASLLRTHDLKTSSYSKLKNALLAFSTDVDLVLSAGVAGIASIESTRMSSSTFKEAIGDYVRAVEKGANDKKRRADRQTALVVAVKSYFTQKPSAQLKTVASPKPVVSPRSSRRMEK